LENLLLLLEGQRNSAWNQGRGEKSQKEEKSLGGLGNKEKKWFMRPLFMNSYVGGAHGGVVPHG